MAFTTVHSILAATGAEPAGGAAIKEVIGATAGATVVTVAMLWLGLGHRSGRTKVLGRAAGLASRISGLPLWVALPSGLAAGALQVALLGMYWDISLHIDQGRDPGPLANPAHYLILVGLYGIFAAGFLSACLTDGRPRATAIRIGRDWYAPLGAVLMCACGAFALIGFPLDDMWHRLFGQDVTLWGPTHLMLIGGAAMSLVGQAVLLVEGARAKGETHPMRSAQGVTWDVMLRRAGLAGGLLIGLSTFQGEFDFGVPQFNFLFQPMLIALAAGLGLVSARVWGGRGAAISAVAFFLVLRGLVTLLVAPVFGETTPHFALYVVEALLVEAVAWRISTRDPITFGAVSGALIGTVGFAAEWAWSHVWMPLPWPGSMLPEAAVVALLAGVAGGVLGGLAGTALRVSPRPFPRGTRVALPAAALVLCALLVFGLNTSPRQGLSATVALKDLPSANGRKVAATVTLQPRDAAKDARWLTVTAWQGGGLVVDRLQRVGDGVYRTTKPIPVSGQWKALIRLHTGRSLVAVPLYLPQDRAIPAAGVTARTSFTRPFVKDKKILQREAKTSATGLTVLAYGVVLAIAASLLGLLAWGLGRLAGEDREPPAPRLAPRRRTTAAPQVPVSG